MGGERHGKTSDRSETVRIPVLSGPPKAPRSEAEMHRTLALHLLSEGAPARAFAELSRAARAGPMSARLAASIVLVAERATQQRAAAALLTAAVQQAEGGARVALGRLLARLHRRGGEPRRARAALEEVLAIDPADRRARRALNALLERESRWDELDASLEKEVREELARGELGRASRATLRRARLWGEGRGNHARAALRYAQAADYAARSGDDEAAFELRLLALRSLRQSGAPPRALEEGVVHCLRAGERVGKAPRAQELIRELGLQDSKEEAPPPSRRRTQEALPSAGGDARKREAHFVARGAWRELAAFYRERASLEPRQVDRVETLAKLAELLEDELHDPTGAAAVYHEIFSLSGDSRALAEQVRLLSSREDLSGVRRVLDEAVERSPDAIGKANARVARAEAALSRKKLDVARADLEQALRLVPNHLPALAGLAEVAAQLGDDGPFRAFREGLARAPRRVAGRSELFRRLARLAEFPIGDRAVERRAWSEVLAETPLDEEALDRLAALAREAGDAGALERLLRAQLEREPRGKAARQARLELTELLERAGRKEDALAELRRAVGFEPGHKEAWLALADRLIARGENEDAARALEQAATGTEDVRERLAAWEQLARFAREVLGDSARASLYDSRAERIRESARQGLRPMASPPGLIAGPLTVPAPPGASLTPLSGPKQPSKDQTEEVPIGLDRHVTEELEAVGDEDWEGSTVGQDPEESAPPEPPESEVMEVTTGDVQPITDEPPAVAPPPVDAGRKTEELPVALGDPTVEVSPSVLPLPRRAADGAERLFKRVRERPLSPECYRQLAEYYDGAGDATRKALMEEIALALEGDPDAAPRAPRLICSAPDRAGLKHPALRTEAGELLRLAGVALAKLHPATGSAAGSKEQFGLESGRGARASAEALMAAVRILGLRAPDLYVAEVNGPPFHLVFAGAPRLLVGKLAVRKQLPEAELRFFAGRALFSMNPELMVLRSLKKEQLARGLALLGAVVRGGRLTAEAAALEAALEPKSLERLSVLHERTRGAFDWRVLTAAARSSANRAGLVVCGGVAPAVAALRGKRALPGELAELVRFAASERYLQLRTRRFG